MRKPRAKANRGNSYYLPRLERDHPEIAARYRAGEFNSATAALREAGLIPPRKPINALLRAWEKASVTERRQFIKEKKAELLASLSASSTGAAGSPAASATRPKLIGSPTPAASVPARAVGIPKRSPVAAHPAVLTRSRVVQPDGHLAPGAVARVEAIMKRRSMRMGDVMSELGAKKLNPSLGLALRGQRLHPDLVSKLEAWVLANEAALSS
jgi:hypothetical protein